MAGDEKRETYPNYWRFPIASTAELARRLAAAGPSATLRVVPYARDGRRELMLHVDEAEQGGVSAESHEPGINESHACPPFCGGGGG